MGAGLVNWGCGYRNGVMVPEAIFEKLEPMSVPTNCIQVTMDTKATQTTLIV